MRQSALPRVIVRGKAMTGPCRGGGIRAAFLSVAVAGEVIRVNREAEPRWAALPEVSLANDRRPSPRWHVHAYGAHRERHMTSRRESAPTVNPSQDRHSARRLI